ncbi:hypothetical protein M9Y10_035058 [Tritrichomonas musculus]|uniref:Uncharacterized protein n=1 Tax=Tritrichomonas musculus TaxID=1915356 RepID=A0ABR2KJV1_9EUKA
MERTKSPTAETIDVNSQKDAHEEIQNYIKKKKELYNNLIEFLENSEDGDILLKDLINNINNQIEKNNRDEFTGFLRLITSIGDNYHREKSTFKKLFQIIEHYGSQIKRTYSNNEIFDIFHKNKKILQFLFGKKIIKIDEKISKKLIYKIEANGNGFYHFFYPEIKKFIGVQKVKDIQKELLAKDPNIFHNFEEKRLEGENEDFICSLIREDSVEEFIEYVNRKSISVNSEITPSIFETNPFLIDNKNTTLIEYSAFFGSLQIFQYLVLNGAELKPELWLYAIHSRNAELIHLLENYGVKPPNGKYEKCLSESIKCHHNEIADYIENNYMIENDDKIIISDEVISSIMQYHNYGYFPLDLESGDEFFYLLANDYNFLKNLFLKSKEKYIEKMICSNITLREAIDSSKHEIAYNLLSIDKKVNNKEFNGNKKITKIAIPSSVTSIGSYAFNGCSSLTQIFFEDPSSLKLIRSYAFSGCSSLKSVSIPPSVVKQGEGVFFECSSLMHVSIPSSMTSIGDYCFEKCVILTQIIIPSSVTSLGKRAFAQCISLTQVNIPSSVRLIPEYAFAGCKSLKQITIPSSVTSIENNAFSSCSSLTEVSFDSDSSLVSIEKFVFFDCALTSIKIPSSVYSIEDSAFEGCSKLKQISVHSSFKKNVYRNAQLWGLPSGIKIITY